MILYRVRWFVRRTDSSGLYDKGDRWFLRRSEALEHYDERVAQAELGSEAVRNGRIRGVAGNQEVEAYRVAIRNTLPKDELVLALLNRDDFYSESRRLRHWHDRQAGQTLF